jgi:hypothetical protein
LELQREYSKDGGGGVFTTQMETGHILQKYTYSRIKLGTEFMKQIALMWAFFIRESQANIPFGISKPKQFDFNILGHWVHEVNYAKVHLFHQKVSGEYPFWDIKA